MRCRNLVVLGVFLFSACDCGSGPGGTKDFTEAPTLQNQLEFGAACLPPPNAAVSVETVSRPLVIRNGGRSAVSISRFELEPAARSVFHFDSAQVPASIGSGEQVSVPITFTPASQGTVAGRLTVQFDALEPALVMLVGEGSKLAMLPTAALACSAGKWSNDTCTAASPSYFFNDTPTNSSSEMTLTVKNGGCPTLALAEFKIAPASGSEANAFSFAPGQDAQLSVRGGGQGTIRVRFTPKIADQVQEATLSFTTNIPGAPTVSLKLQGMGVQPLLVIDPLFCDFTSLTAPCNGRFSLTNSGQQALQIQSVRIGSQSGKFVVTKAPAAGTEMAASAQLADAIQVEYLPAAAGANHDYLVVESTGGTATAELNGGSPPVLDTEPGYLVDFGSNLTPAQDYYLPVTLRNVPTYNGQLPLTIHLVEIDNRPPSNGGGTFDIPATAGGTCTGQVAPETQIPVGGSASACVHFRSPPNGGTFVANLLIHSDDPNYADPAPYLLSVGASTACNPAPVAEVTAPTGASCPCADGKCVNGTCHSTDGASIDLLSTHSAVVSGEASYDVVADTTGQCTVVSPSDVVAWEWSIAARPAGSTATLAPTGKGTANRATLTVDKAGVYVVKLFVWDRSGLRSQPTNFSVTAQ